MSDTYCLVFQIIAWYSRLPRFHFICGLYGNNSLFSWLDFVCFCMPGLSFQGTEHEKEYSNNQSWELTFHDTSEYAEFFCPWPDKMPGELAVPCRAFWLLARLHRNVGDLMLSWPNICTAYNLAGHFVWRWKTASRTPIHSHHVPYYTHYKAFSFQHMRHQQCEELIFIIF